MDKLIKIKTRIEGDMALVRALIDHPMHTGRQQDEDGNDIKAHYIEVVDCLLDDQVVFSANWTTSISRSPYLSFRCPAQAGQTLTLRWRDNHGEEGSLAHVLKSD